MAQIAGGQGGDHDALRTRALWGWAFVTGPLYSYRIPKRDGFDERNCMTADHRTIAVDALMDALADTGVDAGLRIDTELSPIGGAGSPVKPAIYEGGRYQHDRRWANREDESPADVIVIDNVPSQANRLEAVIADQARQLGVPEMVLDLTGEEYDHLPSHLPRSLSSWRWPHRHADAYLIDSLIDGKQAHEHELGNAILSATPDAADVLMSWFPQSLLFGFWQSHLGKKRTQTKHARSWVSEIVGWNPALATDKDTGKPRVEKTLGIKGDAYNVASDIKIEHDEKDRLAGLKVVEGVPKKDEKPSKLGYGQVPFSSQEATTAGVSFRRISQMSIVSFAQLRRVRFSGNDSERDAAARSLLVALGLHAHSSVFGRGFHLRSGADLRPARSSVTWLGENSDREIELGDTAALFAEAKAVARDHGVPLAGWGRDPVWITPNRPMQSIILKTWPDLDQQNSS